MKRFFAVLALCGLSILIVVIIILLISSGKKDEDSNNKKDTETIEIENPERTSFELPIESRDYKIGIAGYTPANFPNSQATEINQFYSDINQYTEVYGVHTVVEDLKILDVSAQKTDGEIVLVTSFSNPASWKDGSQNFISTVSPYLKKYPEIKYLGVGNEINYNFDLNSQEFNNFLESYKQIYSELKKEFPNLIIFTTFQYETLIGKGYLTGRSPQVELDMVSALESHSDAVGLTLYPGFDYGSPSEIPNDYISSINQKTTKPILITETGWHSRSQFNSNLDATVYTGSEQEQLDYLKKLSQLLNSEDILFVNWLSLNDFEDWQNLNATDLGLFVSYGLKHNDGSEKQIWNLWKEYKTIPNNN